MRTLRTGSKRRGFTLLELLVVMAIMVLISGAVLASMMPALAEARLRSASAHLIAALRYARSYAVSKHVSARLRLVTDARTVEVQTQDTDANGTPIWRTLTTQAGRTRTLPDGVIFSSVQDASQADATAASDPNLPAADTAANEATVTFTVLGQAQDTAFSLTDDKGHGRMIQVDGVTGRCLVTEAAP